MREDIVAGLRNALERGASLEQAVQSFINAGYNPAEVQEASRGLSFGATTMINPEAEPKVERQEVSQPQPIIAQQAPIEQIQVGQMQGQATQKLEMPQMPQRQLAQPIREQEMPQFYPRRLGDVRAGIRIAQPRKSNSVLIITLIIILLLLIGGLTYVIISGEEFLNSLT